MVALLKKGFNLADKFVPSHPVEIFARFYHLFVTFRFESELGEAENMNLTRKRRISWCKENTTFISSCQFSEEFLFLSTQRPN